MHFNEQRQIASNRSERFVLLVLTMVRKLKVFVRGENKEISFAGEIRWGFMTTCAEIRKNKRKTKNATESLDT